MRLDTLTYKYRYKAPKDMMYKTLIETQLQYFRAHDKKIKQLREGEKITTNLQTKLQKLDSKTTMEISKIIPEKVFQLVTQQPDNHNITQTFEFKTNKSGKEELIYSEKTQLNNARSYSFFFLTAIIYKYFYNRGMKKKMQYLDDMALGKVKIND